MEPVRFQRERSPGVDSGHAHLLELEVHASTSERTVVIVRKRKQFEGMARNSVLGVRRIRSRIRVNAGTVEILLAERKGGSAESDVGCHLNALSSRVQHPQPLESGLRA